MYEPWVKKLILTDAGVGDDLYGLLFNPKAIQGTTTLGSPVKPFDGIETAITFVVQHGAKGNYVVGINKVPSASISLMTDSLTPNEYWQGVDPDKDNLRLVLEKLPGTGMEDNRAIGHLHLHDISDYQQLLISYAVTRDPFYLPTFLEMLGNTFVDVAFYDYLNKLDSGVFGGKIVSDDSGKGHGSHHGGGLVPLLDPPQIVDNPVVIISTNATGSTADPCIKLVGYYMGNAFVIQQVLVIPYVN